MLNMESTPVRDEHAVGRIIPSEQPGKTEAVVVLPSQGKVKVLNEIGARIWALVDGTRTVHQIVEAICSEYQVDPAQAQIDILEFLNELAEKEAIHSQDHLEG